MQKVRLGKTELEVSKTDSERFPFRELQKLRPYICCRKPFITASNYFEVLQGLILTAKKNWEQLFPIHGKSWLSVPKQRLRMKRISGKI